MEFGRIQINLEELLSKKNMSKSKLSFLAEMQRTQINNYCNNSITRLDTDVLARICSALQCSINDLIKYIPPEK